MSDARQLPRGRHRLSREEVLSSQRGRMLAAVGLAVAEKGYAKTTVADVLKRAGVSRETFYEQFADKEACFLAAYDIGVEGMLGRLEGALDDAPDDPLERFDRVIGGYLEALESEPAFARTFLVEVYAAGPAALERRVAVQARFAETVAELFGAGTDEERFACEALVAAITSLVTMRVAADREPDLRSLREPLRSLVGRALSA